MDRRRNHDRKSEQLNSKPRASGMDRRKFLGLAAAGTALAGAAAQAYAFRQAAAVEAAADGQLPQVESPVAGAALAARKKTLFGIGYETWFISVAGAGGWGTAEARPVLGHYSSLDPKVIRQHAHWIHDAGFDFILIDWSNNLGGNNWSNGVAEGIIGSTVRLLAEYTHLKRRPKFALLLGLDNGSCATPRFHTQIQRIEREILAKPEYARLWQHFDGKPLLAIFSPGPSARIPPAYLAPHFTVRFMGEFHEITLNQGGAWSWGDRAPIINGPAIPIFPFQDKSLRPWKVGSGWSLAHQANMGAYATCSKGTGGALVSPPFTVTERVLTFNYSGMDFWVYSRLRFPGGKIPGDQSLFVLRDAATGAVLRRAFPPGMSQFTMRQWDVADLIGRRVIFEAMAGSAAGLPYGGSLSFGGLAFTRNEQMVASVAMIGNEDGGGGWLGWDAHLRCSGATLVQFMDAAFRYEPEVVLIQQWNEFCAPDQYGVETSQDIEPTVIHSLDGPYSDGWGYYYLDLVTKLIRQYRQGFRVPQVLLDTRYP